MISKDKISYISFWWENLKSGDEVQAVVDTLAGIGYKGIEWKSTCFNAEEDMEMQIKRAVNKTRAAGLAVPSMVILRGFTDPNTRDQNVRDVCEYINMCANAGVVNINIPNGGPGPKQPIYPGEWWTPSYQRDAAAWESLRIALEDILKVAEQQGVYLVLESVVGSLVHDYYTTLEMFRQVDSPNLCLTLDPSHYHLYQNDIPWCVRQWGKEKIRHVHFKDSVGVLGNGGEQWMFPLLGEGMIDWNGFLGALDDIGYDGYLSVEFESWKYMNDILHNDNAEAARISMRSAAALVDNYLASKSK